MNESPAASSTEKYDRDKTPGKPHHATRSAAGKASLLRRSSVNNKFYGLFHLLKRPS